MERKNTERPPAPRRGRPTKKNLTAKLEAVRRAEDVRSIRLQEGSSRLIGELRFARTWINADLLAAEPELESLAWVENRCLSPLERTELFTRAYASKYRRAMYRAEKSVGTPICENFAMNSPAEMNSLWRARAEADRLGLPYELYLDVVIDGCLKSDKWRRPPRPNQLYGKLAGPRLRGRPNAEDAILRLGCLAEHRFFHASAYCGSPVQDAALEIIKLDVESAKDSASRLRVYLVDWRMITRDRATHMFGESLVTEALAGCGIPVLGGRKDIEVPKPACFGFFRLGDSPPCASCQVSSECGSAAGAASAELVRLTGSDDPRLAHRRRIDRERQRRYRHKNKTVVGQ